MAKAHPDEDLVAQLGRNSAADDEIARREIEVLLAGFLHKKRPEALCVNIVVSHRASSGLTCENWICDAEWKFADHSERQALVLRRGRAGGPMEVSRTDEFRVLEALHRSAPFPTPAPLWFDADGGDLGQPFLIMSFLPGRNDRGIIANEALPEAMRASLAERCCRIMAELHCLDWRKCGLEDLGIQRDADGEIMSPLAYWRNQYRIFGFPLPEATKAIEWLAANEPAPGRLALVHGDFRPGNMLTERGLVTAVLDWETAHISDPLEDVGWYTIPHHYRHEHFVPGQFELEDFLDLYGSILGEKIDRKTLAFWQGIGVLKTMSMLARAQVESPLLYGELTPASLKPYSALFRKISENAR